MAQFIKRGSGWEARLRPYDRNGKRHNLSKGGFKTKAAARIWATEAKEKLHKGIDISQDITLLHYYHDWVKEYKKPKLSHITLNRYKVIEKFLKKYFGEAELREITRSQYQHFINQFGSNHAPETVKKTNSIVRACVQSAILDGYIYRDFTQRVTLTANRNRILKVEYLNLKEIKQLLATTTDNLNPRYTSRYMIVAAIYTGARLSELQALTWKDVDFLHHTITINKSWDATRYTFKPAKTKSSNRTIVVNDQLLTYLQQLRAKNNTTMVFQNIFGTIPTSNAVNKTLRSLLSDLGIHKTNFHFHSLRHSHVALLVNQGIDAYDISKRLGHSSISITLDVYGDMFDEYKKKRDKQIVKALNTL